MWYYLYKRGLSFSAIQQPQRGVKTILGANTLAQMSNEINRKQMLKYNLE
jgi:hypothetical protein